jgi:hypothetical protein
MPDPEMDSLLNLPPDEPGEQPPPPAEPAGDEGPPKPAGGDSKTMDTLVEQNKNLQEQVRQISETNKSLSERWDRIVGDTPDEKKKKEIQEHIRRFDENPTEYVQEQIQKGVEKVKGAVAMETQLNLVHRCMENINKTHVVDWDKDFEKINAQLENYSREALDKNPEGCIMAACKLAGAIKKRDETTPPYVEAKGGAGATPRRPAGETEEDAVNKRLNNYSNKKTDNVFGIPDKKEEPKK